MPPRLPIPGSDEGTWGDILNEFLEVSHASDGTLLSNTVNNSQVVDGAVINAKVHAAAAIAQSKIANLTTDLAAKAADSTVMHNTGNESIAGIKTFSSSPVVPATPTTNAHLASKQYVDSFGGTGTMPSEAGWWYPGRIFYTESALRQDSGVVDLMPISPMTKTLPLTGVCAEVRSSGTNGNIRAAVYDYDFNRIQDLGTISATSTGRKVWSVNIDLTAHTTVWIGVCYQGSSTGTSRPQLSAVSSSGFETNWVRQGIGYSAFNYTTKQFFARVSGVTGAYPSTLSPTMQGATTSFLLFYRFG